MIGYFCKATRGTDFTLSEQARRNFKLALMTMASYTDLRDWGLGLAGRHPFGKNGRIPDADVNAFGYLAALGDLTGSGKGADPELAGAYLRLKGTDKELNSLFRKEGISAGPTPSGFFVYNYGAAGIHRRGDWMVTLKAFNTDVWGSEIYTKDNRYGRYQSYGSAPIIGSGNPVSAAASGFVQEGWDWNRVPGATTIHLPYPELESPLPGTLMERNPERFSAPRRSKAATAYWPCISSKRTARTSPPGPRHTNPSSASTTGWSSSAAASTTTTRHTPPKRRFSSCGWTARPNR